MTHYIVSLDALYFVDKKFLKFYFINTHSHSTLIKHSLAKDNYKLVELVSYDTDLRTIET